MSYLMKRVLMQWYELDDRYVGKVDVDTTDTFDKGDSIAIGKALCNVLSETKNGITLQSKDTGIEYYFPFSERIMNGDK